MKKSPKTAATTPAKPASAPVSQPSAKAAKKTVSTAKAPVATPVAAAPVAVAPKATATPPPAVKVTPTARPVTTITAQIDVGFGNTLFLRGEGPGLSWEVGVPVDCVADDKWSITLANVDKPVVFKFLINDLTWCAGEDFVVQPGTTAVVVPIF